MFTIRWASNGTTTCGRQAAIDVRPEREVRHELAVHDVELDAVDAGLLEGDDSSPSREKSAGSTDGAISIGNGTSPP